MNESRTKRRRARAIGGAVLALTVAFAGAPSVSAAEAVVFTDDAGTMHTMQQLAGQRRLSGEAMAECRAALQELAGQREEIRSIIESADGSGAAMTKLRALRAQVKAARVLCLTKLRAATGESGSTAAGIAIGEPNPATPVGDDDVDAGEPKPPVDGAIAEDEVLSTKGDGVVKTDADVEEDVVVVVGETGVLPGDEDLAVITTAVGDAAPKLAEKEKALLERVKTLRAADDKATVVGKREALSDARKNGSLKKALEADATRWAAAAADAKARLALVKARIAEAKIRRDAIKSTRRSPATTIPTTSETTIPTAASEAPDKAAAGVQLPVQEIKPRTRPTVVPTASTDRLRNETAALERKRIATRGPSVPPLPSPQG